MVLISTNTTAQSRPHLTTGKLLTGLTLRSMAAAMAASTPGTARLAVSTSCSSSSMVCLQDIDITWRPLLITCLFRLTCKTAARLAPRQLLSQACQCMHSSAHSFILTCNKQRGSCKVRDFSHKTYLYNRTCLLRAQPSCLAHSVQAALPGQEGDTTAYNHMSHLHTTQSMSSVSVYTPCSSTAPAQSHAVSM